MARLEKRPFELIGVNLNGYSVDDLKRAVEKEQLSWRSIADPGPLGGGAITTRWSVTTIPTLYLIDAKGVIRRKWLGEPGAAAIDHAIDELLAETEPPPR